MFNLNIYYILETLQKILVEARQNNFLQLFHVEWMDNTPPPTRGPAVQAGLVMTGRHGRPKTPWTQADFDFPGTHGRPPSGIQPIYSQHPLYGTNGSSPLTSMFIWSSRLCWFHHWKISQRWTQSQIHSFQTTIGLCAVQRQNSIGGKSH